MNGAVPRGHQCPRYVQAPDKSGFLSPIHGASWRSPAIDRRGLSALQSLHIPKCLGEFFHELADHDPA